MKNKQGLVEKYANSLKQKILGKTFDVSEKTKLANIVGNEFVDIINSELQLKSFQMREAKTLNVLLFTIISEEKNLAQIVVPTKDIGPTTIEIKDVEISLFI